MNKVYKVYSIVVAKNGKKTPEVGEFLKKIFTLTWRLAVNKYNETWLVGRAEPVNVSDIVSAIGGLNKKITGVFITRVSIEEACYNRGGAFDESATVDKEGKEIPNKPGSDKMLRMLMNID